MEKKHIERLYAILERAEREKDTDIPLRHSNGPYCGWRTQGSNATLRPYGIMKRYPIQRSHRTNDTLTTREELMKRTYWDLFPGPITNNMLKSRVIPMFRNAGRRKRMTKQQRKGLEIMSF